MNAILSTILLAFLLPFVASTNNLPATDSGEKKAEIQNGHADTDLPERFMMENPVYSVTIFNEGDVSGVPVKSYNAISGGKGVINIFETTKREIASYCENGIFILNQFESTKFDRYNVAADMFQDGKDARGISCVIFTKPRYHWNGSPEADGPVLYMPVNAIFNVNQRGTLQLTPNVAKMLAITCTIYPLRLVSSTPVNPSLLEELGKEKILLTVVPSVPKYSPENANSIIILDTNPPRLNTNDTEMYTHKLYVPEYSGMFPLLNVQFNNTITWLCSNFSKLVNNSVVAVDSSVKFRNIKTFNVVANDKMTIFLETNKFLFEPANGSGIRTLKARVKDSVLRICNTGLCNCVFIVPDESIGKMDPILSYNTLMPSKVNSNTFISEKEFSLHIWNTTFYKFDMSHLLPGTAVLIGSNNEKFVQGRYSFSVKTENRLIEVTKFVEDLATKYTERYNAILKTKGCPPEQNELIQFGVKNLETLMYYKQLPEIVTKNPRPVIFLDIDTLVGEQPWEKCSLRPFVCEFFKKLKKEVYFALFTAASKSHAETVVVKLKSKFEDTFIEVFYNEDMWSHEKDIGNRGMDTKWCFLVVHKPENGVYPEQTIQVPPFTYNQSQNSKDSTFTDLIPCFIKVAEGFKVQQVLHRVENYAFV